VCITSVSGAVAGAAVLSKLTNEDLLVDGSLGCTVPGHHVGLAKALAVEFFSTLVFVFVVIAGIEGQRPKRSHRRSSDKNNDADNDSRYQLAASIGCLSRPSAASFVSGTTLISVSLMAVSSVDCQISLVTFR